ncbi:MAG: hypothetical protein DMF44_07190 [Verrucomicrobia bacterium]|nr:MAG: hypothetical protein DMF44_07190 [Verrucomicrobiota bacterium]
MPNEPNIGEKAGPQQLRYQGVPASSHLPGSDACLQKRGEIETRSSRRNCTRWIYSSPSVFWKPNLAPRVCVRLPHKKEIA